MVIKQKRMPIITCLYLMSKHMLQFKRPAVFQSFIVGMASKSSSAIWCPEDEIRSFIQPSSNQNESLADSSSHAFLSPDFSLGKSEDIRVKRSVSYIVCGLLFRTSETAEDSEVLLMQEAKEECRQRWYVPAGRLEPEETIEDGVRREVEEETGLTCDPQYLISVEVQGGGWYRFTFFCALTGGRLKSKDQADKESIQAKWFPVKDVLDKKIDCRAKDMFRLIKDGEKYFRKSQSGSAGISKTVNHFPVPGMFIRFLIVQTTPSKTEILVTKHEEVSNLDALTGDSEKLHHLPVVEYTLNHLVPTVISKFYRELVKNGAGSVLIPDRCIGVDCLPVPPREHDGLCLTLLCAVKPRMNAQPSRPERYQWHELTDEDLSNAIADAFIGAPEFYLL